jgi:hypothetical protein
MHAIRNYDPAGKGAPTITVHGIAFELDRSTTTAIYRARVAQDDFAAFLASAGHAEPAPTAPNASLEVSLTDKATADVKAFHAADAWALSIPEKRVRVLASDFGVSFAEGRADLPPST